MQIKAKISKWDLIKLKMFCTTKETISKVKRQPSEWEKVIANEATDKELISKTYKQLMYSCPSSQWCHSTISSSVVPFSSWPQSFPASGSFQMSQFFTSGSKSIGVAASASVLPMNTQDWFPLGLTDLISLQSKGLSRVFSLPSTR